MGQIYSAPFRVNEGLRQGCCLSPTLYKIYIYEVLKNWSKKCGKMGINVDENFVHSLSSVCQLILVEDRYHIIYLIRRLAEEF